MPVPSASLLKTGDRQDLQVVLYLLGSSHVFSDPKFRSMFTVSLNVFLRKSLSLVAYCGWTEAKTYVQSQNIILIFFAFLCFLSLRNTSFQAFLCSLRDAQLLNEDWASTDHMSNGSGMRKAESTARCSAGRFQLAVLHRAWPWCSRRV